MNPFEILGVAPSFALDPTELSARQRDLSRALHPDKFVGRPQGERRAALGRAIEVNEAHRALKNPLSRAEALLGHLGWDHAPQGEAAASPEFLMEVLERREELRAFGRAQNLAEVERLRAVVQSEATSLEAELSEKFSEALTKGATFDSPVATEIQKELGQLRYLRRFLDEADALLDEML